MYVTRRTTLQLPGGRARSLVPKIPHPVILFSGEQGTGKSTSCAQVLTLLDPSPAPLHSPPREQDDWAVVAAASWMVALDNLSSLPPWLPASSSS